MATLRTWLGYLLWPLGLVAVVVAVGYSAIEPVSDRAGGAPELPAASHGASPPSAPETSGGFASEVVIGLDGPLPEAFPFPVVARHADAGLWVVHGDLDRVRQALGGLNPRFVEWDCELITAGEGGCCGIDAERYAAGLRDALSEAREATAAAMGSAWDHGQGEGIVVAVLDTGADGSHVDLNGKVLAAIDVAGGYTQDLNGHGTAMASLIAAHNHEGLLGAAPEAMILPVVVAQRDGRAKASDVATGIRRAVAAGARVLSLSLGTRADLAVLREAVEFAEAEGVLVVASAGNEANGQELYPAAYPTVLSVGNVDDRGGLTNHSVIAPGIDLFAPGQGFTVALPFGLRGTVSGTSVATARVSGVAALMLGRSTELSPAALRAILKGSARPIEGFQSFEGLLPAGWLTPEQAVIRSQLGVQDAAVTHVRSLPRRPLAGAPTQLLARVANSGSQELTGLSVEFVVNGAIVATARLEALAVGAEAWVSARVSFPESAAQAKIEARVTDAYPNNNSAERSVAVAEQGLADLSFRELTTRQEGSLYTFAARVENLGHGALAQDIRFEFLGSSKTARVSLEPGQSAVVEQSFTSKQAATLPLMVWARAESLKSEIDVFDNQIAVEFRAIDSSKPLETQYQQSNGVDWIFDAPWRINPNVDYIPVLVYAPSKGSTSNGVDMQLDGLTLKVKTDPADTAPGTTVFASGHSAATTVPQGFEMLDEVGQAIASQVPFEGNVWKENGRYRLLKLPVAALPYSRPETIYIDGTVEWRTRRHIIWSFYDTTTGSHRKVLQIRLSDEDIPRLPGLGHYYDVHFHTESEWHGASSFDILAPRKAYGGPHVMVRHAAYAMGFIDDPNDVFEKICTTDHNCFYNLHDVSDPNSADFRPPFGLISIGHQPGTTEFEATRQLYGRTAAEEVAISHSTVYYNLFPVPLGGHMILYQAEHQEGPWHGGSSISQALNAGDPLELDDVLRSLAKNNRSANRNAFAYSAHAMGGGFDWGNDKRALALVNGSQKTKDFAHAEETGFVFKGHQLWNSRTARRLDSSKIDFENLNPWVDTDFVNGWKYWDNSLWEGLDKYHEELATLIQFAFDAEPDVRFIRKHYVMAASDAHGDFNYSDGRAASIVDIQSTYSVDDGAFFKARSYVLGDGKSGQSDLDRLLAALGSGNAVVTDGPLLEVSLDSEMRFDSEALRWDDSTLTVKDPDGRIGGNGKYDGGFTALVPTGAQAGFSYRYSESDELGGDVAAIHIYKTGHLSPNPNRDRHGTPLLDPVGHLDPSGAGSLLSEAMNPAEEGVVNGVAALSFAAFTGVDPDVGDMTVDDRRCFTNPIWVGPVAVDVQVAAPVNGKLAQGAVTVTLDFPISMSDTPLELALKALNNSGVSTDKTGAALATFTGTWSAANGAKNSRFTATNDQEIPLNLDRWPDPQTVTFMLYTEAAPQDYFGNALNPFATTFTQAGIGTGGGTGVSGGTAGSGSTGGSGSGGTTGGGTTGGSTTAASGGGGGGGGSCSVSDRPSFSWPTAASLMLLVAWVAVRGRARGTR